MKDKDTDINIFSINYSNAAKRLNHIIYVPFIFQSGKLENLTKIFKIKNTLLHKVVRRLRLMHALVPNLVNCNKSLKIVTVFQLVLSFRCLLQCTLHTNISRVTMHDEFDWSVWFLRLLTYDLGTSNLKSTVPVPKNGGINLRNSTSLFNTQLLRTA